MGPTKNITPRPNKMITPRPTKNITPRPTVWNPPKTPRPTPPPKTPKPTNPPKTPRPTSYVQPEPTETYVRPTPTYIAPAPMSGCAENTDKNSCKSDEACVWKMGYPPLAFSEDSDYQLLENEESFFAVDGSVIEMIGNMDSNMLMLFGVMFVAVFVICCKTILVIKEEGCCRCQCI